MKKNDFILEMLAKNVQLFLNPSAMSSNIKDAIIHAAAIYDEAERILKELGLEEEPKKTVLRRTI